ncbi:MAG: TIGR03009 domain-containing protein [Fimbriiglobus sp.]
MSRWICAGLFCLAVSVLAAQSPLPPGVAPSGPTPAPAVKPIDPVLKQHLDNWEYVMKDSKSFFAKGKKTFEKKDKQLIKNYEFEIMCMTPGRARLRQEAIPLADGKKDFDDYTAYIANESVVYEYDGIAKKMTERRIPPGASKGILMLDILSGTMTAAQVLERFDISILKQDEFYVYLDLKPKTKEDLEDFELMTLVLFTYRPDLEKKNIYHPPYLPRQVVIRGNNGQEITNWDFPKPIKNSDQIKPEYFVKAPVPAGWATQVVAAPARGQAQNPPIPASLPAVRPVVPAPGTPR